MSDRGAEYRLDLTRIPEEARAEERFHRAIDLALDALDLAKKRGHVDAASKLGGDAEPKEADATICIHCGSILIFDERLRLRMAEEHERKEIEVIPAVRKARDAIRDLHERRLRS